MIPSQIEINTTGASIKEATSDFRKPVLTKREYDWYRRHSTANEILRNQEALVKAQLAKPWELLNIAVETPEQKRWREQIMAERAATAAKVKIEIFLFNLAQMQ